MAPGTCGDTLPDVKSWHIDVSTSVTTARLYQLTEGFPPGMPLGPLANKHEDVACWIHVRGILGHFHLWRTFREQLCTVPPSTMAIFLHRGLYLCYVCIFLAVGFFFCSNWL